MILKFTVPTGRGPKEVYVPKVKGQYLESVPNLGIYVRTKDPHAATRFSSKEDAKKCIEDYKKIKWRVVI